jgi:manganese/zinc/iron transport system substrate-binding protein
MKKKLAFLFFVIACVMSTLIFLRIKDSAHAYSKKHFTIVTTTSMLADAVRMIVRDVPHTEVHGLMGPGVDPHLYRARESDVHTLAAADLIVYNGLHLEGKMGQVLEGMQRFAATIAAADALDTTLLRATEFENLYDPHIWFDVSLWIMIVRYIQENISALDPEYAALYTKNSDEYIAQLEQLNSYIKNRINEIDTAKRILITAHDAFGYFGAAYGFTVVGLQGLSTDCDISTKDIQELADYIVEKKIPALFVESSIPQRSLVAVRNAVAARGYKVTLGAKLYSDALGDEQSGASSYFTMVKYNVDAIIDSLK